MNVRPVTGDLGVALPETAHPVEAGALAAGHSVGRADMAGAIRVPDPGDGTSTASTLHLVHGALRGRYPLVVVLGLMLGVAGAWAGWRFREPLYRSEGLVRIRWQSSDADSAPFDVFMQSQQTLITSRRVVDRALTLPPWLALKRPMTDDVIRGFASNLVVEIKPRTDYLKITYTDADPTVACAAVRAVTAAYVQTYESDEKEGKAALLRTWEKERRETAERIALTRKLVEQMVSDYGSADLGSLHDAAVQRAARLEMTIEDLRVEMTSAAPTTRPFRVARAGSATQPAESAPLPDLSRTLSPEEIAVTDGLMAGYLQDLQRLNDQLALLRTRGYLDSFRDVVILKAALVTANDRIRRYASEYNTIRRVEPRSSLGANRAASDPIIAAVAPKSPEELREQEAKLIELRNKIKEEMIGLERARLRGMQFDVQLRKDQDALDTLDRKVTALAEQDQTGGRLTVINAGDVPLSPARDLRIKASAAGALAGTCLPAGAFTLLGFARRRYRYVDDTAVDLARTAPLLGIVPTVRDATGAAEEGAVAAQRIHQIRVMLQVGRTGGGCATYLVTSASAGEGKTTVTLSLALSFAATGARTLVIDGDFVAQQLTRGMDATEFPGLHEALRAGSLQGCVRRTASGLFLVPAGHATASDACALSPKALDALLEHARAYFDVIIVDSGPVLGSVEASLFARSVEGVILAVTRGQQPLLLESALQQLQAVGARMRGFVFNRAMSADFHVSGYRSSSVPALGLRSDARRVTSRGPCRFGPVVGAVASSLPFGAEPSLS